ncbi:MULTISPECIES: hypothetical protein [Roseobacteraceae]|uniref:Uncharacterized protein n=1 Tax=Pseudosulfitobacter pseudonitzschiae TaxID=1402135 RepID=A0A221K520_9RHOB|nr:MULTISPECIES: hypothetical protein [Roseobacteraceae]ASM73980.1 hypothetical protein SULPSESMR1_03203 [Pseudosulfitobacter pseudonitzschiae]
MTPNGQIAIPLDKAAIREPLLPKRIETLRLFRVDLIGDKVIARHVPAPAPVGLVDLPERVVIDTPKGQTAHADGRFHMAERQPTRRGTREARRLGAMDKFTTQPRIFKHARNLADEVVGTRCRAVAQACLKVESDRLLGAHAPLLAARPGANKVEPLCADAPTAI